MANSKIYDVSEEYKELILDRFKKSGLESEGLKILIWGQKGLKEPFLVKKSNPTIEHIIEADESDTILCYINEDLMDKFSGEYETPNAQELIIDDAFRRVFYTNEGKLDVNMNTITVSEFGTRFDDSVKLLKALGDSIRFYEDIKEEEKKKKGKKNVRL